MFDLFFLSCMMADVKIEKYNGQNGLFWETKIKALLGKDGLAEALTYGGKLIEEQKDTDFRALCNLQPTIADSHLHLVGGARVDTGGMELGPCGVVLPLLQGRCGGNACRMFPAASHSTT